MQYNSYRLPSVEANDQWWLLAVLLDRFNNILKKKHSIWQRRKYSSNIQYIFQYIIKTMHGSHMPGTDGQSQRIPLWIASPSSIFARFNPLRLFPVSKSEEMIWRKESSSSPKQRLILKDWTNYIIRTAWKNWRIIGSSISSWGRLCWEIKMNRSKKMCLKCVIKFF